CFKQNIYIFLCFNANMKLSQLVEEFIDSHPSIKDCLQKDLINYSSLSSEIMKKIGLNKNYFNAVLVASRRYLKKLKIKKSNEQKIISLLKESKLELKNKISVTILDKSISIKKLHELTVGISKEGGFFHLMEGTKTVTIVTGDEFLSSVNRVFKNSIIQQRKGLIGITLITSREIENISGVVSFLYSLYAENGINILETFSSWTDTLFVIEEKDLARVMEILKFE
ncbi:MAG: hypothetical protein Q7K42_05545, partial [Candidatus Diapherotrites archaeon]|nr:hypothetical protein [Candidatus Diapherotrites archaeon]